MFGLTPLHAVAGKEQQCPVCGEYAGHGHGQVEWAIRDIRYGKVRLQRMRYRKYRYTYRVYPKGLEPHRSCAKQPKSPSGKG